MTHDFENIRQRCLDAGDGCWIWGDALSNGTPAAYLGGRVVGVRRLEVPQWWVNRVARGQAWAPLDSPFRALVGVVL